MKNVSLTIFKRMMVLIKRSKEDSIVSLRIEFHINLWKSLCEASKTLKFIYLCVKTYLGSFIDLEIRYKNPLSPNRIPMIIR